MGKSPDAFRTISEVADWLDTPAHVLRFWESKFSQVKPVKRAGGRRYYRPADMLLIGGIKKLLHDDGLTIKGVQKILREQGVKHVASLSRPLDDEDDADILDHVDAPGETTAEVVPFQSAEPTAPAEPKAEETDAPAPEAEPPQADSESLAEGESDTSPEPSDETPETEQEIAEEIPEITVSDPVEPAAEPADSDSEETDVAAEEDGTEEPEAIPESPFGASDLPGFLRRPADAGPPEPIPPSEYPPAETAEPEEPAVRKLGADIPPDPDDADLDVSEGVLTHISRLRSLSHDDLARIAPLVEQLCELRDKMGASGKH